MKIRIADRILVALAGLILIALCAATVAQVFFGVQVTEAVRVLLDRQGGFARPVAAGVILIMLLTGVYCVLLLFRHRKRSDGFVVQKTENGELAISMKALQDLVMKCTDKHDEMTVEGCDLENTRDGLMVRLKVKMAGGISIPMTVSNLQKQIRQYVTACSGVDVGEILVKVETGEGVIKDSPFAIAEPSPIALLKPAPNQNPGEPDQPAVPELTEQISDGMDREEKNIQPEEASYESEDYAGEDGRPMHQRIFRPEEEAQIVPCPPDLELKQNGSAKDKVEDPDISEKEMENSAAEEDNEAEQIGFTDNEIIEPFDSAGLQEEMTLDETNTEADPDEEEEFRDE